MHKTLAHVSLAVLISFLWWLGVNVIRVPTYFLPSSPMVWQSLVSNHQALLQGCFYTISEALIGFILAALFAISLASLCYFVTFLRNFFHPLAVLSQTLPLMVLAPLIVLWLGFGETAKITIVVLSLFFPIFIATLNGFNHIPKLWLELAYTFQATRLRLFFKVILPGSFSYIAAGLKISIAWAMLSAIIAEWVGGNQGLGFLMQNAMHRLDSAFLFASLILLIMTSLVLYAVVAACLNFFLRT